jgi:hypothetical protein
MEASRECSVLSTSPRGFQFFSRIADKNAFRLFLKASEMREFKAFAP